MSFSRASVVYVFIFLELFVILVLQRGFLRKKAEEI